MSGWCGTESHPAEAHEKRSSCVLFTPDESSFSMRRALIAVLLTCVSLLVVLPSAAEARPRCTALGHRIAHTASVTENTAPGFRILASLDAWADTDLRVTSDGVAVHSHDRTLRRTFGVNWKVEEHTWADLSELRSPNGQRLMTWDVATRLSARWNVPIVAEMKQDVETWTDAEIESVTSSIDRARVWLGGQFNKRVHDIAPSTELFWRPDVGDAITPTEARERHASLVMANPQSWSKRQVTALKQAHIRVGSRQSGGHRSAWRESVRKGVKLISTSDPYATREWCT